MPLPEKRVKSVVLTQHPELYAWVQDTLPNFSGTVVKVLYALQQVQQQTNSTAAALDALLDDIARSRSTGAVDDESLRLIVRQELSRALGSGLILPELETEDEDLTEIQANLEAIL